MKRKKETRQAPQAPRSNGRGEPGLFVTADLREQARARAASPRANATTKAYKADWADFEVWCNANRVRPLPAPPNMVAVYLESRAQRGNRFSTIQRSVVSISHAHQAAGHPSPTTSAEVRDVIKGLRRTLGVAPIQKAPLIVRELRDVVVGVPDSLVGLRDRALLLLGFAGAFRRSELVALKVEDLRFVDEGLTVTVRRSKTDQVGAGRRIGIPRGSAAATCPVQATRAWIDAAGMTRGPLFRAISRWGRMSAKPLTPQVVALLVKRYCELAGLPEDQYAGHSLRAGLATSAAIVGKSERAIMGQTGHRSVAMVRRYIRDGELYRENAADDIGL